MSLTVDRRHLLGLAAGSAVSRYVGPKQLRIIGGKDGFATTGFLTTLADKAQQEGYQVQADHLGPLAEVSTREQDLARLDPGTRSRVVDNCLDQIREWLRQDNPQDLIAYSLGGGLLRLLISRYPVVLTYPGLFGSVELAMTPRFGTVPEAYPKQDQYLRYLRRFRWGLSTNDGDGFKWSNVEGYAKAVGGVPINLGPVGHGTNPSSYESISLNLLSNL